MLPARLRICLMTPEFPPFVYGGIGAYVRDLAEQLAVLGAEVTVVGVGIHPQDELLHGWGRSISLPQPSQRAWGAAVSGACRTMARLPLLWRAAHEIKGAWNAGNERRKARLLSRFLRDHDDEFEIVEVPNWPGQGAYLRPRHARLVVRLSSPSSECGAVGKQLTNLEAASCRHADMLIGNSRAIIEKVAPTYKLDRSKTVVIPHGVQDVEAPSISRRSDGLDIVVVGRSEPRKGTDILLRSLPGVLAQAPTMRVTFVGPTVETLIGPFPELKGCWDSLLRDFPGQIRCLGRVSEEEKVRVYAESHWLAIPSRFESFGLTAIEGLRAGTPFLSASSGGLSETVAACSEARLVDPNTPEAWEAALLAIAGEGPAAAEALRVGCRRNYESRFTARRMAEESLRRYRELLEWPPRARRLVKCSSLTVNHG